jgi:hypothetical protein
MAQSRCPKCEGTVFETASYTPAGSALQLTFVQCASCGAVLGAFRGPDIGAEMNRMKTQVEESLQGLKSLFEKK